MPQQHALQVGGQIAYPAANGMGDGVANGWGGGHHRRLGHILGAKRAL